MMDIDHDELDDGIRGTVMLLRELGYNTIDSGDGSKSAWQECAMSVPNVSILVPTESDWRAAMLGLVEALAAYGLSPQPLAPDGSTEPRRYSLQLSADAADGTVVMMITGLSDADLA